MCSSTAKAVAQSDLALNQAQTAMTKLQMQDYSLNFANYEQVMQQQQAKLQAIAANPMGYSQPELAQQTTAINENTSRAAKQALGAAGAFAAAHGAADVGSGPAGMISGEIASQAGQEKAAQLSQLSANNAGLKRQNFWTAMNGLQGVGQSFGSAAGQNSSASAAATDAATNAGSGAVSASQVGWQDASGLISGIAGLGSAAAGAYKDFNQGGGAAYTPQQGLGISNALDEAQ